MNENDMVTNSCKIQKVKKETSDTFSLVIKPSNGLKNWSFAPGQFNMLYIYGVGEIPISISGDPTEDNEIIHTTRAVGSVTKAMQKLKKNEEIGLRGPFGTNWPVEQQKGKDIVIIAGGIGLAPLRPAMLYIQAHRADYGRVILIYGARTPEDILFRNEIEKWSAMLDLEVFVTVDRATSDWHGNVGVVTKVIDRTPMDPMHTVAMICGPEIMIRFAVMSLEKRGVDIENVFVSMERNMKCGVGLCGHCQFGTYFICKDGPVFRYPEVMNQLTKREL